MNGRGSEGIRSLRNRAIEERKATWQRGRAKVDQEGFGSQVMGKTGAMGTVKKSKEADEREPKTVTEKAEAKSKLERKGK